MFHLVRTNPSISLGQLFTCDSYIILMPLSMHIGSNQLPLVCVKYPFVLYCINMIVQALCVLPLVSIIVIRLCSVVDSSIMGASYNFPLVRSLFSHSTLVTHKQCSPIMIVCCLLLLCMNILHHLRSMSRVCFICYCIHLYDLIFITFVLSC